MTCGARRVPPIRRVSLPCWNVSTTISTLEKAALKKTPAGTGFCKIFSASVWLTDPFTTPMEHPISGISVIRSVFEIFRHVLLYIRLTALTVHALSSITLQRYSDPGLLKSALTWMHGQQTEDGSFADGANATLGERIDATAFVLTCLSDVQHDDIVRINPPIPC